MDWATLKDWGFTIGSLLALVSFVRLLVQDIEARRARLSIKTTDAAKRGLWVEITYRPTSQHAATIAFVKLLDQPDGELWGGNDPVDLNEARRNIRVSLAPAEDRPGELVGTFQVMPRVTADVIPETLRDGSYALVDPRRIELAQVEIRIAVGGRSLARRRLALSAID